MRDAAAPFFGLDGYGIFDRSRLTLNEGTAIIFCGFASPRIRLVFLALIARCGKRLFFQSKLDKRLNESPAGEKLVRLLNDKIANGLLFTEMLVADADAYTIFETLNARGAMLSSPDLLKNFLFCGKEDVRRLKRQWGGMLRALGRNDSTIFMRHLWTFHGRRIRSISSR